LAAGAKLDGMGKAKGRATPKLVPVSELRPGQRIRFHNGLWVTNPKVYEVVRFRPLRGLDRGYLELKDPQTGQPEAAPDLLHGRFQVELVS
jgi:hypothetical protein